MISFLIYFLLKQISPLMHETCFFFFIKFVFGNFMGVDMYELEHTVSLAALSEFQFMTSLNCIKQIQAYISR
jgi:hypothetical protein